MQPKRAGLLLAPETGEDGLLQMGEIYGLGLKANLVVLVVLWACQTARGREITGEGLIGLSRAFFYAGARSVVATLWNLNDRFAAEFVPRFYTELNQGHSSEEALRRAKVAYVNHPPYSHPFYWSSLVMLGDGTRLLVEEPVTEPLGFNVLAFALALGPSRSSFCGPAADKCKELGNLTEVIHTSVKRPCDFRPEMSTKVSVGHIFLPHPCAPKIGCIFLRD